MLSTNNDNSQQDTLPETMLPADESKIKDPKLVSIDQLGHSLNSFIDQFKKLEREHAKLKTAFEAQHKELQRSRAEYQRKIEEWRAFKASLGRSQSACKAAEAVGEHCGASQETASLLIIDQGSEGCLEGKKKRMRSSNESTPRGFWQVDFTPAIDSNEVADDD